MKIKTHLIIKVLQVNTCKTFYFAPTGIGRLVRKPQIKNALGNF